MNVEKLIDLVNSDLKNERKHLHFYQQASVMVHGLHRMELREFLAAEAASELQHVNEFSELVVHLGGIPEGGINIYPMNLVCPKAIVKYAIEMEEEVANIYAERLRQTHEMEDANTAYVHVFYEDQIRDSWRTAKELKKFLKSQE